MKDNCIWSRAIIINLMVALAAVCLLMVAIYSDLLHSNPVIFLLIIIGISTICLMAYLSFRRVENELAHLSDSLSQLCEGYCADKNLPVENKDVLAKFSSLFACFIQKLNDEARERDEQSEVFRIVSAFKSEIAVWRTVDSEVRFISANCLDLIGYADSEFYSDPLLLDRLIHPDDREKWDGHYVSALDTEGHTPFQIRMVCKDGTVRWMHHSCHNTFDNQGRINGRRGNFSDVTSVFQAQNNLHDKNIFIENLINSAAVPMFVINSDHKVIYWNQALEIITGLSQQEMRDTGLHWSAFYKERRQTLADIVVDGKTKLNGLYKHFSPSKYVLGGYQVESWLMLNNEPRYLLFEAAPIKNSAGEIIAAIETLEDITERRLLEESLTKLTRAVEQSSSSIVITDTNGKIEYVNPMFVNTTGYSTEEVIGKTPALLKSGEMSPDSYSELWQIISNGKVWRGEFHNKRKDGSLYWEAASISPIFDKQHRISGYLAIKDDITEQKAVRAQLSDYEGQLEQKHAELEVAFKKVEQAKLEWEETLDQLHDFIILTDAKHRIKRYNKLLANLTGRSVNELIGRDWRELFKEIGFEFLSYTAGRGELIHDRSARSYDLNEYPVKAANIVTGYVISLNDTTELHALTQELGNALAELKDAQMQIFQQEKLASIGQLAAGVAHEINNPMGFISSNLGTLEKYVSRLYEYIAIIDKSMQPGDSEHSSEPVNEARKRLKIDRIMEDAHSLIAESLDGAGRVRRIVQDLKSFSRVDQAETAWIDLNEALETTINIAWNEIKYVATLDRNFGEIPKIKCFPQQLNQVFLNLLVNASHALSGSQGSINISTYAENDTVVVQVSDTGCGMTEDVQKRIFEPFFTTKEVGKGTGLGLSISYDIIKKHGGSIEVQSELGKGTTFAVRLPIEPHLQQVASS